MSSSVLRRAPAKSAVDRTRRPPAAPAPPLVLPPSVRFTLDGGTRVEVVERRGIPEVYVCLAVEAGSAADPAGRGGAAELAARVLSRGAGGRGRLEMARWLDRAGAFFRVVVHHDVAVLMLFGLREAAGEGLAYLASVVTEPAFAEGEVAGARAELLAELSRQAMDPAAVADRALAAALYGDHPYGRPVQGTQPSVAALDAAAVRAFHRARYGGAGAVLVASGDVDADAVRRVLERELGGWAGGAPAGDAPPAPEAPPPSKIVLLDRPGLPQVQLRVGAPGVPAGHPGQWALTLAATVLGGVFNSRLNQALREENGWSYGARARVRFRRAGGHLAVRAAVENGAAARALAEIRRQAARLAAQPPTDDELRLARNALAFSLPVEMETNGGLAQKLVDRTVYAHPHDVWERYAGRLAAVTPREVAEAAARWLAPERLALVAVGDARRVAPELEEIGAVEVRPAAAETSVFRE